MKITDSIANISMALSKFQAAVTNPKKESVNPHFKSKYADLDSIINAIRPALNECDLAFIQNPVKDENGIGVYTILLHKSGEYIQFDPVYIPIKAETPHQVGAALTYARRYSLGAALGIATDEDDDGNSIQQRQSKQQDKQSMNSNHSGSKQPQRPQKLATEKQRRKIFAMGLDEKGLTEDQLKKLVRYQTGKENTKELTMQEASELIELMSQMNGAELVLLIGEKAVSATDDEFSPEEIEEAMH